MDPYATTHAILRAMNPPKKNTPTRTLAQDLQDRGYDARLLFFWLLLLLGYLYVAAILNGRANPFLARHGGHQEFLKLFLLAPFLYFLGPRHSLLPFARARKPWLWNGLGFALPYFIGLHFYCLQKIDAINYSLTPRDFARMGTAAWILFAAVALLILAVAAFCLHLARKQGYLPRYLAAMLALPAFVAFTTCMLRKDYYLHLHHWAFFGAFVPYLRFQHPLTLALQGLCAGIMTEGIATWSMSTIWEPR